ncbi:MmgE/PrpD family protein [Azohydromonas australica]|uniref:MmgE/PrpD family protein n=1 Tax=Azohydromonas australica TaxID=364039 RepID=UPI00040F3732|nr:MmgE/PrpD family protein [Azohydromonas australica]
MDSARRSANTAQMTSTPTQQLTHYAASTSIACIPDDVVELAKKVILDEMASAQFGRRSLAGGLTARYAASLGGPQEALVLGTRQRVPAPYAALANGAAGHGEEVDGAHVIGGHPGATLVHAVVAMAERHRSTGAELINALVLAYDVGVRMVEACGGKFAVRERHHLYADFLYSIGATVAACRLMGLEPVRHAHAMALVTFQCNALGALFAEKRHISKSFCNGQFALAGVSAASMSAAGLEGVEDVLGMRDGLLDAWGAPAGAEAVTRGLGSEWAIRGANFKFINAGYPIHAAVESAMTVVARHGIALETIAAVHIGMPAKAMRVVDNREMHNICVQDMVCASLALGGLNLRQLPFPDVLNNTTFTRLRAHTVVGVDEGLDRDNPQGRGANVTITTSNGSRHSHRVDAPRGHSSRGGVTWEELHEKWRGGLPDCDVDRMLTLTRRLEHLEDVRELADAFMSPI